MAKRKRGAETLRDMVLTLGVIAVFIIFLMLVAPHSAPPFKAVDYQTQLTSAREVAPYHVLAPEGLTPDWKANAADYNGADPAAATWHLGFVTPSNQYAAVDQSDGPSVPFITATDSGATADGDVSVAGATWQRYDGKTSALVRTQGNVTTIVSGTGGFTELTTLASALR